MEPFIHNIPFMETFASVAGDIQVLAAVRITGNGTLVLAEMSVAPVAAGSCDPGYVILRGIMEQISGAACAQGFEVVEFE